MKVNDSDEFQEWTRSDPGSLRAEKADALQRFCDYHAMSPAEFLTEASRSERHGPWLLTLYAEERIRTFYQHLVRPVSMQGAGLDAAAADGVWKHVRAFYKHHGFHTVIEALAGWEHGPLAAMRDFRTQPFGTI